MTTSSRAAVAVGWGRTLEDKLTTLIGSSCGVNRVCILSTGKKADRVRAEETLSAHAGYPISEIEVRLLLACTKYIHYPYR